MSERSALTVVTSGSGCHSADYSWWTGHDASVSAAGNWRSSVARLPGMMVRSLLFVAVLCVGCGEVTNDSSAGTTQSSGAGNDVSTNAPTTSPIAAVPSTSIADDRSGYVTVGARHAPQVPEEALAQTVAGLSDAVRTATLGPPPVNRGHLAEVDGNRTRQTGIARLGRFEGGGAHQVPRHLRRRR